MGEWTVLTPEQVGEAVAALAAVRWPWTAGAVDQLSADLGWPVTGRVERVVASLRTGYPVNGGIAEVQLFGDVAEKVVVPATDAWRGPRFPIRTDALALVASAAARLLGAPPDRRPGVNPQVQWPVAGGALRVIDNGIFVAVELLSPDYATRLDGDDGRRDPAGLDGILAEEQDW
jgi:hypothetical protein